jgi:hypothetical protein
MLDDETADVVGDDAGFGSAPGRLGGHGVDVDYGYRHVILCDLTSG